ncbi:MAG TPA: hypothetical protein VFY36_12175 [Solirubrobacteraceae bacterium]|nr:hypothetical protein [Solirubrobacteraceae bacterium]
MRPEYGPTLGWLLAPRWHAARRATRAAVAAAGVGLVVAVAALALTLENSSYSHGGRVPFHFSYRGLYRTTPDPGGYVRVQAHKGDGALRYSYAVDPLRLPRYSGELFGELPIYASDYIRALARRHEDFVLRGEGKTRVNVNMIGYQILYTARVGGREVYGRDILLLPPRAGARDGVAIVMLTSAKSTPRITSPQEIPGKGVLLRPLKTFAFG